MSAATPGHLRAVIIGGGIAGLATAWQLTRRTGLDVTLLEEERLLASHASGRNAAIFRHVGDDSVGVELALRSRELLVELTGDESLLRPTGALYAAQSPNVLASFMSLAKEGRIRVREHDRRSLRLLAPLLAGGETQHAIEVPEDGVLDVHAIIQQLARLAREGGARIRVGAKVAEVTAPGRCVRGVRLEDGDELLADVVIIAAGARASQIGETCGVAIPLSSFRRHLAFLASDVPIPSQHPIVWRLDRETYFRPESGGLLASPCDEERWPAGETPASLDALEPLARKLAALAPPIASTAVRRFWACLRTFAPDRGFVIGEDPRCRGLFWIAGLGGRGMTCGLAAAEMLATQIFGSGHPWARHVAPVREQLECPCDSNGRSTRHVVYASFFATECSSGRVDDLEGERDDGVGHVRKPTVAVAATLAIRRQQRGEGPLKRP